VKTILTHEALGRLGRERYRGRQQCSDDVKKITKQRRYIFNNPVQFVGDRAAPSPP
jgi:hypothetical protein